MPNRFDRHLLNILEYVNSDQPRLALDEYEKLIDENAESESSHPVVMSGKKGQYLLENAYLIERLMAQSKRSIKLYTYDINESAYGHVVLRNMLYKWLQKDDGREVKLLVGRGFSFFSSGFYFTNLKFIKNGQLEVRVLDSISEFSSYAGIFDMRGIKIKEKSPEMETMVGIFSDQTKSEELDRLFEDVFALAIPAKGRVVFFIAKLIESSRRAKERKGKADLLSKNIKELIKDSYINPIILEKSISI
ncbi:MAG: hypothetical protein ABW092_01120 [Candidatus Thiodiazotropha sp.]